jgi:hypothetical protein
MNNIVNYLLIPALFILLILHPQNGTAQSGDDSYMRVTYYQVDREGMDQFLNLLDAWEETKKEWVQKGEDREWRLYHVPHSSSRMWYNYVSIDIAPNLNALDKNPPDPGVTVQQPVIKLHFSVKSEFWITEGSVPTAGSQPSRFMNTNFMYADPGRLTDYLELEKDIAAPLHENQQDNGRMDGWNFYRLVFPTGTSVDYNFITADYYSSLEQIEMGITRDIIEQVHPDMDVDEFEAFADSIRERVWSDLWELVNYVK